MKRLTNASLLSYSTSVEASYSTSSPTLVNSQNLSLEPTSTKWWTASTTCTLKAMLTEISNLRIFCSINSLSSSWQISGFPVFSRAKMEQESFTPNWARKATWPQKFLPKIMMEPDVMFLPQELFFLSCMLETLLLKKPFQMTLTTNSWRTRNMIPFGKPIQEEDQSIISPNNLKIYLLKWSLLIQHKDQKSSKLLLIHGLRAKFVPTQKSRNNSLRDKKNWTIFLIKEGNNNKCKSNKTWPLQLLQAKLATEEMARIQKMKLCKTSGQNSIWKEFYQPSLLSSRTILFWTKELHMLWLWLKILWET